MKKLQIIALISVFLLLTGSQLFAEELPFEGVTIHFAAPHLHETDAFAKYAEIFAKEMGMNFEASWFTFDGTRDKLVIDFTGRIPNWDLS